MAKAKNYQKYLKSEEKLIALKKMVNEAYEASKENFSIYHNTRNFLFISNIDSEGRRILNALNDPEVEFNVVNAIVGRVLGEYSNQNIGFFVSPKKFDIEQMDLDRCKILAGHMKYCIESIDNYEIGRDVITGGFGVIKIYTDYEYNSFNLDIKPKRAYDPTLIVFDQFSTSKTKEDAQFYAELIPITKEKFKEEYGEDARPSSLTINGLRMGKTHYKEDLILICHLYAKESKKVTIYLLDDNESVTQEEYDALVQKHKNAEIMGMLPQIVDKREEKCFDIVRYEFSNDKILRIKQTDFTDNSFIFCDGNSILTKTDRDESKLIVIPMIKYAVQAQKLLNRTGQLIVKFMETLIHGKWLYPAESIPKDQEGAYDPQQLRHVPYIQYDSQGRELRTPALLQNPPFPPEIMAIFNNCTALIQTIMGTYDAALGINDNNLSGKAIENGSLQSNAAIKPYVSNILESYKHLGKILLKLIPKYFAGRRTLPYISEDGSKRYQSLDDGSLLNYNPKDYDIDVKATFNFELQKAKAMDSLIDMSKTLPSLSFILNNDGLPYIFDNYKFEGSDQFKLLAQEFLENKKRQEAMQQQQGPPIPPEVQIQMQKVQNDVQKLQLEAKKLQQDFMLSQQKMDLEHKKVNAGILQQNEENEREREKLSTEREVHAMDNHIKHKELDHNIKMDHIDNIKNIAESMYSKENQPKENNLANDVSL